MRCGLLALHSLGNSIDGQRCSYDNQCPCLQACRERARFHTSPRTVAQNSSSRTFMNLLMTSIVTTARACQYETTDTSPRARQQLAATETPDKRASTDHAHLLVPADNLLQHSNKDVLDFKRCHPPGAVPALCGKKSLVLGHGHVADTMKNPMAGGCR